MDRPAVGRNAVFKFFVRARILLIVSSLPLGGPVPATGQGREEPEVPPLVALEHHPWARFPVGSWRKARIVEQTLDADRQVTNETITIRTERLTSVAEHHFTLVQDVTTEFGGGQVQAPTKTVTLVLLTEEAGEVESLTEASPESVTVDGREVETQVLDVRTSGEVHSIGARIWYSATESPFILRSVTEAVSPTAEEPVWQRSRKVVATDLPFTLRGDQFASSFFQEQQASPKTTRHSVFVQVAEVPGGIAARWTKEVNAEGKLIRREVESLLDWGVGDGEEGSEPPTGDERLPEPGDNSSRAAEEP